MSDPRRIGVFGGTFDPIHNTHLAIARATRDQAKLDLVLFVVSANPPHKRDANLESAEDRLALVEAALAGEEKLAASRIEIDRDGPSYTADTLEALQQQLSGADFFLIIGMDSLIDLPKWRTPERILTRAHLLVVPRPGESEVPTSLRGKYTMLRFPENGLSSTDVRARLESGDPCSDVLPTAVSDLIRQKGLYRECAEHSPR